MDCKKKNMMFDHYSKLNTCANVPLSQILENTGEAGRPKIPKSIGTHRLKSIWGEESQTTLHKGKSRDS